MALPKRLDLLECFDFQYELEFDSMCIQYIHTPISVGNRENFILQKLTNSKSSPDSALLYIHTKNLFIKATPQFNKVVTEICIQIGFCF